MALYTISDTHLSFSVPKPMDIFGSRWSGYTEKLAAAWREQISETDTVVIGGDISWAMSLEEAEADLRFLDELPGKKIIGRGNHDYWWDTMKKMRSFLSIHQITTIDFLFNNAFPCGPYTICGSRGWWNEEKAAPGNADYEKILAREAGRLRLSLNAARTAGGEPIVFLHFPPVYRGSVCTGITDVLEEYGIRYCYYGHLHTLYDIPPSLLYNGIRYTLVSADYLNFRPMPIETESIL